jgi:hypothetical protein
MCTGRGRHRVGNARTRVERLEHGDEKDGTERMFSWTRTPEQRELSPGNVRADILIHAVTIMKKETQELSEQRAF